MIIDKISIKQFRGFRDVEFYLGSQLTVIAGQNGTQKTTILGMLSQPFTISDSENPMKGEKPLCGGSFKSAFSEKFKLSDNFDKPKEHEWTLYLKNEDDPFILESIPRSSEKYGVRFWRKGDRSKGAGYIQLPVIFLSLKRLLPIGEDNKLQESSVGELTEDESTFFNTHHKKILISQEEIANTKYLESPDKNTLGVNTAVYDWKQNSAGQDNISKILLAIISFQRLKRKYPAQYRGGILAIDELDATLYPGSQIKLIHFLRSYASKLNVQIIFSTHSLSILKTTCELQEQLSDKIETKDQVKVVFLHKQDNSVIVTPDIAYNTIEHRLNVTISENVVYKISAFTEDKEAMIFVKALLKGKANKLSFVNCTLGCGSLVDLGVRKIPSFTFPNSFVFLDGDVRTQRETMKKINRLSNYMVLPFDKSPERILAEYLHDLPDDSEVWTSINPNFTKQYCFRDYSLSDIERREQAKLWFTSHLKSWGNNASKVINPWIKANKGSVDQFVAEFVKKYNTFAKELGIPPI